MEENLVSLIVIFVGVVALIFFVSDKYPIETVSISLLSALVIIQLIFPSSGMPSFACLISGFSNPGLITVISLLVMAEGLVATGVISYLVNIFDTDKKYNSTYVFHKNGYNWTAYFSHGGNNVDKLYQRTYWYTCKPIF